MDPNPSSALEAQIQELTARIYRLERTMATHGISPAPEPTAAPAMTPAPIASQAAPAPTSASVQTPAPVPEGHIEPRIESRVNFSTPNSPAFDVTTAEKPAEERSLENRIGSQWFNRIGILALLIGMAWFLKLAIDNHWIGPLGRVLIGLIAGAALIGWSEHFQRRGYRAFSYSLKAAGTGMLYLSLWAAFSLYGLIPAAVAFAAMILVTAFNGFLAWVQDAELIALYAIAGGLSTPLLLSTGGNHELTLLTYLLLLDIAVLVLVILRPWSRLLFASFSGTVVFFAGWWFEFYSPGQLARTAVLLTCFFLLFALAPRLVRIELKDETPPSLWDNLALVVLPIATAALGFVAYYSLFDSLSHEWGGAFLAVAFAAFYLVLIRLPHRGALRPSTALVSSLHLTVAIVFLTIAFPLKAHGRWLTIGWLVEGTALFWLGVKQRSQLLQVLALLCLGLGLAALVTVDPAASGTLIFNTRFGTYLVAIAAVALVGLMGSQAHNAQPEDNLQLGELSQTLPPIAILLVNVLILLALSLEIHHYWWSQRWSGSYSLTDHYLVRERFRMYAQFTYSALFMLFGAALLTLGFWRRSAFIRWQALVLLAAAIAKVFLLDVSQLSQGYRILSFFGLGALLLAVSFVYQRDWLHLRHSATPERRPE